MKTKWCLCCAGVSGRTCETSVASESGSATADTQRARGRALREAEGEQHTAAYCGGAETVTA